MPQYKRKLSKGERWWYKFDYNGKTYSSKAIYPTKQECKRAEAECLTNARDEELGYPNMTVKTLCDERLKFLKAARSGYYCSKTKSVLARFCEEFGRLKVREITKKMISDYLSSMSTDLKGRGKDNFCVNTAIRTLKALFYYAIDVLEVIDRNPVKGVKPYPITKRRKYIPPDSHIDLVYGQLNEEQKKLFIFVKETGCRISEALRGKSDDLGQMITLWTCKTRHGNLASHTVPSTEAIDGLKLPTEGRLFPTWTEYPRFLEDACSALKIRKFGWHSLRHRKASQWAEANLPLIRIRDYLGHSDISTTNIYLQSLGYDLATDYRENVVKTG